MTIEKLQPTTRHHLPTLEKKITTNGHSMQLSQTNNSYEWFNHEENNEEQEIKTPTTAREMTYNLTKALEKWCNMSQEQRDETKIHEFAEQYKISYAVLGNNVNKNEQNGLSQEGEYLLSQINNKGENNNTYEWFNHDANNKCESTNTDDLFNHEANNEEQEIKTPNNTREMTHALTKALEKWRDMPQKERDKTTLPKFAELYNIKYGSFRIYANRNGLKQEGLQRLLKIKHNHKFNKLYPQHVKEWCDMGQKKQNNLDLLSFTEGRNLLITNFRRYCTISGGITCIGKQLLRKYDGHEFNRMTPEILKEWRDIPQEQRDETKTHEFAERHNVNIVHLFRHTKRKSQLRTTGIQLIQKANGHTFNPITKEAIQRWGSMSQKERDGMRISKFCEEHNLYYGSFQNYVYPYGITNRGEQFLNRPDKVHRHSFKTTKNRSGIYQMMGVKKKHQNNSNK